MRAEKQHQTRHVKQGSSQGHTQLTQNRWYNRCPPVVFGHTNVTHSWLLNRGFVDFLYNGILTIMANVRYQSF